MNKPRRKVMMVRQIEAREGVVIATGVWAKPASQKIKRMVFAVGAS
jgi:hypothetical protein